MTKLFDILSGLIDIANNVNLQTINNDNIFDKYFDDIQDCIVNADLLDEKLDEFKDSNQILVDKLTSYISKIENLSSTYLMSSDISAFFNYLDLFYSSKTTKRYIENNILHKITQRINQLNDIKYVYFNVPYACQYIDLSASKFNGDTDKISYDKLKTLKFRNEEDNDTNEPKLDVADATDRFSLASTIIMWPIDKQYDYISWRWRNDDNEYTEKTVGMLNSLSEFPFIYDINDSETIINITDDDSSKYITDVNELSAYLRNDQLTGLLEKSVLNGYIKKTYAENTYITTTYLNENYVLSSLYSNYATSTFIDDLISTLTDDELKELIKSIQINDISNTFIDKTNNKYIFNVNLSGSPIQRYFYKTSCNNNASGSIKIKEPFSLDDTAAVPTIELHIPISTTLNIEYDPSFLNASFDTNDELPSSFTNTMNNDIEFAVYTVRTMNISGNWKSIIKYRYSYHELTGNEPDHDKDDKPNLQNNLIIESNNDYNAIKFIKTKAKAIETENDLISNEISASNLNASYYSSVNEYWRKLDNNRGIILNENDNAILTGSNDKTLSTISNNTTTDYKFIVNSISSIYDFSMSGNPSWLLKNKNTINIDSSNDYRYNLGYLLAKSDIISLDLSGINYVPYAFAYSCEKLKDVNLNSLTAIYDYSFKDCMQLSSMHIIGNNLKCIHDHSFENCNSLRCIDLSNCSNLHTIGKQSFKSSALSAVDFSSTKLSSINENAFKECNSLSSITFNDSLKFINDGAFENCSNLSSIDFSNCTLLEKIGNSSFASCDSIDTIDLSKCTNLKNIGANALCSSGLSKIELSGCDSLNTLESSVFMECKSLSSLDFGSCNSLSAIGVSAFTNSSLTSLVLPSSLNTMVPSAETPFIGGSLYRLSAGYISAYSGCMGWKTSNDMNNATSGVIKYGALGSDAKIIDEKILQLGIQMYDYDNNTYVMTDENTFKYNASGNEDVVNAYESLSLNYIIQSSFFKCLAPHVEFKIKPYIINGEDINDTQINQNISFKTSDKLLKIESNEINNYCDYDYDYNDNTIMHIHYKDSNYNSIITKLQNGISNKFKDKNLPNKDVHVINIKKGNDNEYEIKIEGFPAISSYFNIEITYSYNDISIERKYKIEFNFNVDYFITAWTKCINNKEPNWETCNSVTPLICKLKIDDNDKYYDIYRRDFKCKNN